MKKFSSYIVAFFILAFVAALIIAANRRLPRKMDERITLRANDKIPYGFSVAKNFCASLFPNATIATDDNRPGDWKTLSSTSNKQAVIIVSGFFNADEYEMKQLTNFVSNGNYVFIIAKAFSAEAQTIFNFSYDQNDMASFFGVADDSLKIHLQSPPFASDSFYVYPGRKFESWFDSLDVSHTAILGTNGSYPNFIRMDKGEGQFFVHTAPLAFSNYFILHKNNIHYFEQALSVIPKDVNKIVWNEYYLIKRNQKRNQEKEPNWLGVLLKYPEFRWGLLTILSGVILFVLLNSRRKQRMIPEYTKPKNESLDFVKTMGRLYYDRKDHQNLSKKMAVYFLEHVRSTYKLPTNNLDEQFIVALYDKSGYSKGELNAIISFINYLQNNEPVTEYQLINFQNQLETFYQNT